MKGMKDGSSPVAWPGTGKQELPLSSSGLPNIRLVPLIWHGYGAKHTRRCCFHFTSSSTKNPSLPAPTPGCGRERDKVSSVMLTLKGRRRETSRSHERQMTMIPMRYASPREQASQECERPTSGRPSPSARRGDSVLTPRASSGCRLHAELSNLKRLRRGRSSSASFRRTASDCTPGGAPGSNILITLICKIPTMWVFRWLVI